MSTVEVVKMYGLLELSVNQLRFDTDVQCRASIDSGTVTEYKEALTANVVFPPLVVFHDGTVYWVADGFHRGSAYRESGATKCPCDVRSGTKRDAILYACGANAAHGQRRKREDVQRAIRTLLKDSEWRGWTDVKIAKQCHATDKTVATIRTEMAASSEIPMIEGPRKAIRNGKEYTIDTSNIGKTKPVEAKPEPVREPELVEEVDEGEEVKPVVAKDLTEANEAAEAIRIAKTAIATLWNKCPVPFRWKLKASIENHLADLSEIGR